MVAIDDGTTARHDVDAAADAGRDLSLNRPGQLGAEKSAELRRRAPVRAIVDRLLRRPSDQRIWRLAAAGERRVARTLRRLPPSWHVLHGVPIGLADDVVDHLVIGPAGVIVVNVEDGRWRSAVARSSSMTIDGRPRGVVQETARAARYAGVVLEAPVLAVAATIGNPPPTRHHDSEVMTLDHAELPGWIASRPDVIDAERVCALVDVARRESAWRC